MHTTLRQTFASAFMLATLALAAPQADAGEPTFADTPDMKDLPARWTPLMDEFRVPGMSIAVVKDGKLYAAEGFGTRDGDSAHKVDADTMFYIASITKTYTAFAICMLADQGKLSLDDLIKQHLPRFKLADGAATDSITIRDLLCHRAGLDSGPIVGLDAYTGEITEDRYYHWLAKSSPKGETSYSNVHYTLLGRIIEAKSGLGWREYLEANVFKPAGMRRTTGFASRMYADENSATPMELTHDFNSRKARTIKTDAVMHAAGGLGTTAKDAARWIILNVNDGEIDGKRLLSADLTREMRTLEAPFPKPEGSLRIMKGFGLAWQVGEFAGRPLCSHGGGYIGTAAYLAILPEQKSGFIILMNTDTTGRGLSDVIAIDLLNKLTGENRAPNLLEGYQKRTAEIRARRLAEGPSREAMVLPATSLSVPVAAYVGAFKNPHLGTLHVAKDNGGVSLSLGAFPMPVTAKEKDRFSLQGPFELNSGEFGPTVDGKIKRVWLIAADGERFLFER